ncbi:type II toxin-antitoxin system RelE/ParE family toxin [Prosthecobacter sp.]|uniref:type II toxin-antitoxin system RelE/ParE family toxin n=1 Tax=Prosthecobacter sp. TaxID=1965333 RepID=UPI00378350DC
MNLVWNDSARLELLEAASYYGHIDGELGGRFGAAMEAALVRLRNAPLLHRRFKGEVRKVRVERFPYAILYRIEERGLHLVAVMHLNREPGYWHGRLE